MVRLLVWHTYTSRTLFGIEVFRIEFYFWLYVAPLDVTITANINANIKFKMTIDATQASATLSIEPTFIITGEASVTVLVSLTLISLYLKMYDFHFHFIALLEVGLWVLVWVIQSCYWRLHWWRRYVYLLACLLILVHSIESGSAALVGGGFHVM